MSTGISSFDRTVQKTHMWLNELSAQMAWDDQEKAYAALRATLHALRDRLPPVEAAELGGQLPMLIRGFYYEGWNPSGKPLKERRKKQFLAHIDESLKDRRLGSSEEIARSVFKVLKHRITQGEMQDVTHILPREIRKLFE
jgi:uncharacterized protein (DUF2267 family)